MRKLPSLQTENQERDFWAKNDSTEFLDWAKARRRKFPTLKPSLKTNSSRLPSAMVEDLKVLANRRDVPYQSLLKVLLAERIERELRPRDNRHSKPESQLELECPAVV